MVVGAFYKHACSCWKEPPVLYVNNLPKCHLRSCCGTCRMWEAGWRSASRAIALQSQKCHVCLLKWFIKCWLTGFPDHWEESRLRSAPVVPQVPVKAPLQWISGFMKLFWGFDDSFLHPRLHSTVTMSSTSSYSSSGETSPEDIPRGGGTIRVYLPNKQRTVVSLCDTELIYKGPLKSDLSSRHSQEPHGVIQSHTCRLRGHSSMFSSELLRGLV